VAPIINFFTRINTTFPVAAGTRWDRRRTGGTDLAHAASAWRMRRFETGASQCKISADCSIGCHRRHGVGGQVHANPQLRGVTAATSACLVSKSQIAEQVFSRSPRWAAPVAHRIAGSGRAFAKIRGSGRRVGALEGSVQPWRASTTCAESSVPR
jgi:hypothetical protein